MNTRKIASNLFGYFGPVTNFQKIIIPKENRDAANPQAILISTDDTVLIKQCSEFWLLSWENTRIHSFLWCSQKPEVTGSGNFNGQGWHAEIDCGEVLAQINVHHDSGQISCHHETRSLNLSIASLHQKITSILTWFLKRDLV